MSILVFAENAGGIFKKSTFEAITYAVDCAKGGQVSALVLGSISDDALQTLALYGASKVIHLNDPAFDAFDARAFAKVISEQASQVGASTLVISNTYAGKALAARVAVRLKAALIPAALDLPQTNGTFRRSVFSNKGFADVRTSSEISVIGLTPNAYKVIERPVAFTKETISAAADFKVRVKEVQKVTGKIPLTEAERVVSGGRGLKAAENWGILEDLASALGAATACSKPVSDMHWRPHDEHVGQTGITIKPDLYIAIGISGAIQHLAGVSGSKVIVAINTDKEAPFFKIADYGIIGDAFDILPRLTKAVKDLKSA